jgi:hypothetical protein
MSTAANPAPLCLEATWRLRLLPGSAGQSQQPYRASQVSRIDSGAGSPQSKVGLEFGLEPVAVLGRSKL